MSSKTKPSLVVPLLFFPEIWDEADVNTGP